MCYFQPSIDIRQENTVNEINDIKSKLYILDMENYLSTKLGGESGYESVNGCECLGLIIPYSRKLLREKTLNLQIGKSDHFAKKT